MHGLEPILFTSLSESIKQLKCYENLEITSNINAYMNSVITRIKKLTFIRLSLEQNGVMLTVKLLEQLPRGL